MNIFTEDSCPFHFCSAILLLGILLLSPAVPAQAQSRDEFISIPGSYNPVGSGARALGMGGAFIAVADDATAASWNPGGLIQLETPEISVVGAMVHRREKLTFGTNPEASGNQSVSFADLNYLSLAVPFNLFERDMIVALNYQKLFDFDREWTFNRILTDGFLVDNRRADIDQTGDLGAFGLAYSLRLNPKWSIGFTVNFWEDILGTNEWTEKTRETANRSLAGLPNFLIGATELQEKKTNSFSGVNANLGVLWRATPKLTVGAVLKSPFTADLDVKTVGTISLNGLVVEGFDEREDFEIDMPMSYGLGVAYRYSDALSVAFDLYRTEWQDFILKSDEGKTSPITGLPKAESDIDATTQARLGVEYLFIRTKDVIPLRGGVFYDPAPATGSPDDIFGFSLGSGYARGSIVFDVGYQFRWANDIGGSPADLQKSDFSYDLKEHSFYSSLIVHF